MKSIMWLFVMLLAGCLSDAPNEQFDPNEQIDVYLEEGEHKWVHADCTRGNTTIYITTHSGAYMDVDADCGSTWFVEEYEGWIMACLSED